MVICHQSGHMGVFNTAALERLGVTAQTPAPAGGVIGRENGTLTGYMEENAFLEFQKRVPMRPLESFLAAYRKAQDQSVTADTSPPRRTENRRTAI